jgi:single-stranded-DNA-specific exonuclease
MQWQVFPPQEVPQWLIAIAQDYTPESDGRFVAQLLWQRGIRERQQLIEFLDFNAYQPCDPFAFGQEMKWAIQRLITARKNGEKVTIWGDFDADGITATSVLWEGLGEFFSQQQQLNYHIPNRLKESHGLNCPGIDRLAKEGTKLIVTCDTGSTNLKEIDYANQLGIDIIITDHHTLPEERPPVIAIINPRYFAENHPLFHLSGVAVAYKLVEAFYQTLPQVPQQLVEELLDLVAIGLITDLVKLNGDCRYLAQKGIQKLQERNKNKTRIGVALLLESCKKNGDRPTDISFGLGPRINAVSRIHGEASFCVELLTSRDEKYCRKLVAEVELANTRRKALQKDVSEQVKKQLSRLDLSTTSIIVLEDSQWQIGVLGLVAGQIAQEYGRPTILLSSLDEQESDRSEFNSQSKIARGSARSANNIDLYELVNSQAHLLHKFGGHPFAAGLSLPRENVALLREAINQQVRQQMTNLTSLSPIIQADLVVTVAELGIALFRELKLLEPCGMGNPAPKLLIKNCWFKDVWHENIKDSKGQKLPYIKTTFKLWDDSVKKGFLGMWWEHYKDDIPQDSHCDAIVELDYNNYRQDCEVRLIAVRPCTEIIEFKNSELKKERFFDYRNISSVTSDIPSLLSCPISWSEIKKEYQKAIATNEPISLAYYPPSTISPQHIWQQLLGIAKYLNRTQKTILQTQLQEKLGVSDRTLEIGLKALTKIGFECQKNALSIKIEYTSQVSSRVEEAIALFQEAILEEQFQRQYFYKIPLSTLHRILHSE